MMKFDSAKSNISIIFNDLQKLFHSTIRNRVRLIELKIPGIPGNQPSRWSKHVLR